jgi:hypothetical protein
VYVASVVTYTLVVYGATLLMKSWVGNILSVSFVYSLDPAQQQTVTYSGVIALNNSLLEEVFEPWCPALYNTQCGKVFLSTNDFSPPASKSPVNKKLLSPAVNNVQTE